MKYVNRQPLSGYTSFSNDVALMKLETSGETSKTVACDKRTFNASSITLLMVFLTNINVMYLILKEGCHLFDTKRFSQEQPHLNAAP